MLSFIIGINIIVITVAVFAILGKTIKYIFRSSEFVSDMPAILLGLFVVAFTYTFGALAYFTGELFLHCIKS